MNNQNKIKSFNMQSINARYLHQVMSPTRSVRQGLERGEVRETVSSSGRKMRFVGDLSSIKKSRRTHADGYKVVQPRQEQDQDEDAVEEVRPDIFIQTDFDEDVPEPEEESPVMMRDDETPQVRSNHENYFADKSQQSDLLN